MYFATAPDSRENERRPLAFCPYVLDKIWQLEIGTETGTFGLFGHFGDHYREQNTNLANYSSLLIQPFLACCHNNKPAITSRPLKMLASQQMLDIWQQLEVLLLHGEKVKSCDEWSAAELDDATSVPPLCHAPISPNTKFVNFFLAAIFLLFALMQFNDPDPLRWVLVYGFVTAVSVWAGLGHCCRFDVLLGGFVVCLVWLMILLPEFVNWIQMGMPTITGSMKAEEPHIEYTREFLGLFLCGLVLSCHFRRSRKGVKEPDSHSTVASADVEQN